MMSSDKSPISVLFEMNPTKLPKFGEAQPHSSGYITYVEFWTNNNSAPFRTQGVGRSKSDSKTNAAINALEMIKSQLAKPQQQQQQQQPADQKRDSHPASAHVAQWRAKCMELIHGKPTTANDLRKALQSQFPEITTKEINSFLDPRRNNAVECSKFDEWTREAPKYWIKGSYSSNPIDGKHQQQPNASATNSLENRVPLIVDGDSMDTAPFTSPGGFRSSWVYPVIVVPKLNVIADDEPHDQLIIHERRKGMRLLAELVKFPRIIVLTRDKQLQQDLLFGCHLLPLSPTIEFVSDASQFVSK
jgi:hypothetical protein